jgi:electron transfer flavoprotein beta subunit
MPIPTFGAPDLRVNPATVGPLTAKVKRVDYFVPAAGRGAEMLQGKPEEIADKVVELVRTNGGLS